MSFKQVLSDGRVPVKIWTDDIGERSKEQLASFRSRRNGQPP